MRKFIFTAAILISCLSFKLAEAQVHVSLGVNIGAQPEWGPVGYNHVDYYYIPDVDAYYDVPAHQYVYFHNNVWIHAAYLPGSYRNYDIYHGYKVVVNQPNPWLHHRDIHTRYARFRGRRDQVVIRDSHDARYRNHWHEDRRDDRDHRFDNDHYENGHHDNGNHGNGNWKHGNGNHGNGNHGNGNHGNGNNGNGNHGNGNNGNGNGNNDGNHGNGNNGNSNDNNGYEDHRGYQR